MNVQRITAAALAACLAFAACGQAEVYRVSDLATLGEILTERANPGDVIELEYGTYYVEAPRTTLRRSGTPEAPIIIRGVMQDGKRPVIDARNINVFRAVFVVPEDVHDVIFENLEMRNVAGSRYPDQRTYGSNASPIYFEGCKNVTVRNCESHNNENGFFATSSADFILIENCHIHHNATKYTGQHHDTHNFYFNARRQMVKNCYIHDAGESQNWKSRGGNTIFAFNWVENEFSYSLGADSDNSQNTLWLGNVVVKRAYQGIGQGRIAGLGDGTGVARGTVVALNNSFVTIRPRDFYLFTERSSTGDFLLLNNVFHGPGARFLDHNGQGRVYGSNNWVSLAAGEVPEEVAATLRGQEPGFVDAAARDLRPAEGSPLIGAGVSGEDYLNAVRLVTQYSRGEEGGTQPSAAWLRALEEIERPAPAWQPVRRGYGYEPRPRNAGIDAGAYQHAPAARQVGAAEPFAR